MQLPRRGDFAIKDRSGFQFCIREKEGWQGHEEGDQISANVTANSFHSTQEGYTAITLPHEEVYTSRVSTLVILHNWLGGLVCPRPRLYSLSSA